MVWIKGPRCGVGNCASQFYQILAGKRVCQYGHVQEGLETTSDQDDYTAFGKLVRKKPSASQRALVSQKNAESQTFRGKEAKIVMYGLLQEILQHQVRFLKSVRKLPSNFESIVRDLWSLFLQVRTNEGPIQVVELVGLLYLATRVVNVPILLIDFHLWIYSSEMPYFQCWLLLDPRLVEQVPPEQMKQLRPANGPGSLKLHYFTKRVKQDLEKAAVKRADLKFAEIDPRYVCYRMCRDLMLPPQIYIGALRLLPFIDKARCARPGSTSSFEEIPTVCIVLIAAKMYYGLDGVKRKVPRDNQFNPAVWRDVLRKTWLLNEEHANADERFVKYWEDNELENYLSWYQKTMLPSRSKKLDHRLQTMFPLPEAGPSSTPYADMETIKELSALVHSMQDPEGRDYPHLEDDEEALDPATMYPVFSVREDLFEEMPEPLGTLYGAVGKLLGADKHDLRLCVRLFELWFKRNSDSAFAVAKPKAKKRKASAMDPQESPQDGESVKN